MGKKALLVIDVQNGFCPGGNLAVPDGDAVVPVINRLMQDGGYDLIAASQDWHPADHGSFFTAHPGKKPFEMGELSGKPQVMWPPHCVQGTADAEFHPALLAALFDVVQKKGLNPAVDSYSAFRDNDQSALTGLHEYLKKEGITELHVCGLATEYCVAFSALDAAELLPGVKIVFIEDASRGLNPADIAVAKDKMEKAGIATAQSADILPSAAQPRRRAPRFGM